MISTPIVVLDACVLIPDWLRDLFLRAAEKQLLQFRWTKAILDEMQRNLQARFGVSIGNSAKLVGNICNAFDDGEVIGFERHIDRMTNDPKDRHVMAAALQARARQLPKFVTKVRRIISVRTDDQLEFIAKRVVEAMRSGNTGDFLVAVEDQALANPDFARKMKEGAQRHRLEIAQAMLQLLAESDGQDRARAMTMFASFGVTLSAAELLKLTPAELDALIDRAAQGTQ